jgi:hypothetical protein
MYVTHCLLPYYQSIGQLFTMMALREYAVAIWEIGKLNRG